MRTRRRPFTAMARLEAGVMHIRVTPGYGIRVVIRVSESFSESQNSDSYPSQRICVEISALRSESLSHTHMGGRRSAGDSDAPLGSLRARAVAAKGRGNDPRRAREHGGAAGEATERGGGGYCPHHFS